jgi:hypothetical protein
MSTYVGGQNAALRNRYTLVDVKAWRQAHHEAALERSERSSKTVPTSSRDGTYVTVASKNMGTPT